MYTITSGILPTIGDIIKENRARESTKTNYLNYPLNSRINFPSSGVTNGLVFSKTTVRWPERLPGSLETWAPTQLSSPGWVPTFQIWCIREEQVVRSLYTSKSDSLFCLFNRNINRYYKMNAKKSKRNEKSTVDKRMYFEINKASFKSHLHHFCDFFFFFKSHNLSSLSYLSSLPHL